MLWELIATVFAGFGAAGIILTVRAITRKKLPRWLIPASAGIGMLAFQVYNEYNWFEHQTTRLPEGVVVIKAIPESAAWRPWSHIKPQVFRFIAADIKNAAANKVNPDLLLVDLYFFERRQQVLRVVQVVNCQRQTRTDFSDLAQIPPTDEAFGSDWITMADDDPLFVKLCQQ